MPLREHWVEAGSVAVLVVAAGWWAATVVTARSGPRRAARWSGLVAVATTAVYVVPVLAPVAAATWFAFGLAVPQALLDSRWRRSGAVAGLVLGDTASAALLAADAEGT